jgi:hypothetical protein
MVGGFITPEGERPLHAETDALLQYRLDGSPECGSLSLGTQLRSDDEQLIGRSKYLRRNVFQVVESCMLEKGRPVWSNTRLHLRLLDDCHIDSKANGLQYRENCFSHLVTVFGRVESRVQPVGAPCQVVSGLSQYLTQSGQFVLLDEEGADSEVLGDTARAPEL